MDDRNKRALSVDQLWWSLQLVRWFAQWGLLVGFASLLVGVLWAVCAQWLLVPHAGMWHVLPVAFGLCTLLLRTAVRRGA